MLAHKAFREAVVAAEAIAGKPARKDWRAIPAAIFSDPEIAYVGWTQEGGDSARSADEDRTNAIRGRTGARWRCEKPRVFVKTVIDATTRQILGVHIVGPRASDMISEAALALEMGALADDVATTIHRTRRSAKL